MIDYLRRSSTILTSDLTVELIKTNATDIDVCRAAWVSQHGADAREKDSKHCKGLIKFLMRNGHTSPFEHGSFTFFIEGPLSMAREFMRHRTFSYNETSARYRKIDNKFYVPPQNRPLQQIGKIGEYEFVEGTAEQHAIVVRERQLQFESAWKSYERQLDAGIAKEVARGVLPVDMYTQFYATANPVNLMRYLVLRLPEDALWEIRMIAGQIEKHFAEAMPMTHEAWKEYNGL